VDVDSVGDNLGVEAVVGQDGANDPGGPVMQAGHPIKGVRRLAQAVIDRLEHLLIACTAVSHCEFNACGRPALDQVEGAIEFGCYRDRLHNAGCQPGAMLLPIRAAKILRRLGTKAKRLQTAWGEDYVLNVLSA